MTIKETVDQYYGAFLGQALCDTCWNRTTGVTFLADIHNGYGGSGHELTAQQRGEVYNAAKKHDKQHPDHQIRIIYGHDVKRTGQ